jgi:hypothetical protein
MELSTPNVEYTALKIAGKDILLSSSCRASFKSPFNRIDVTLKPKNASISYYEVRITSADDVADIGVGTLASWSANIPANTEYQFSIDINETNFTHGDGAYRISFYAKSALDGSWDVSYLFFTIDQSYFTLSDGSIFAVLTDRDAPSVN